MSACRPECSRQARPGRRTDRVRVGRVAPRPAAGGGTDSAARLAAGRMACIAARAIGRAAAGLWYDLAAESRLGTASSLGGLGNRLGRPGRRLDGGVFHCGAAPARFGRLGPAACACCQPLSSGHPRPAGRTSPRPAVGEAVGGRAARRAEAAGHRGRTADVRAKTSAERTVVAHPDTKRLAIPGAKPGTHGQPPRLHQGAWHPDVPARGALVPRPPSAICRPLLVGFAARPPPARSAVRLAAVPVRQYLRRPAARSGRVR